MPVKLNLLPPEHVTSGSLGKILKIVRSLNVILLALFLFFALGLGAYFIFSTTQLKSLTNNIDQLKSQVSTLESSEQQIVLLKDRIGKVKVVQGLATSSKNLTKVDPFVATVGGDSTLNELDVDSQKMDLSIVFKTNSNLSAFLKSMNDSKVFTSVSLSAFSYNPASGYLATFHIL